ncbi:hypothetical protein BDF19DRAFT_456640 [Syncephalis fuscata]|nr:hypothetical protein BDF19DRAFT_456640 [Syncephalis fuscata]
MPVEQTINNSSTSWEDNADRLFGIPLHPLGEISMYDFVSEIPNDRKTTQARLWSFYLQLFSNYIIAALFARNALIAIRMIRKCPHILSGWCCLFPSVFGVMLGVIGLIITFGNASCRPIAWYAITVMPIANTFNSAIVLQKAYIVLLKKRWILIVGFLFMLPQLAFAPLALMYSFVTVDAKSFCVVHYSSFIPMYWFGFNIPINIFFSAIFIYVAYKQYQQHGTESWRKLMRNGIQVMCLVALCNLICVICAISNATGNSSAMFFIADW